MPAGLDASRLAALSHDLPSAADDQTYGYSYTPARQISQRTASNDNYAWSAPAVARTYERNGLNRYTSVGGVNFSYDGRGNLTSDGSRAFAYDLENRLASVSGSASMSLAYDPLGRLHQTSAGAATTQFLYDGDRLVAEYNASGTLLRRYVHGPGVDEPVVWYEGSGLADARHLMADERGSIIAASGASTTRHAYGPYGEPDTWTGPRFRYTGQAALPEVQLYHYKARVYDPVLGRFLQTDPIGYEDDLNLYGYVGNDPVNLTDPTGLCPWCGDDGRLYGAEERSPQWNAIASIYDGNDDSLRTNSIYETTYTVATVSAVVLVGGKPISGTTLLWTLHRDVLLKLVLWSAVSRGSGRMLRWAEVSSFLLGAHKMV